MTSKTRKLLIIALNFVLVGFVCFQIFVEYKRVGKFQWLDPNAIEDNEEFYLMPIFVIIALLGISSIVNETLGLLRAFIRTTIGKLITALFSWISLVYGTFLLFVSSLFLKLALGNIGNHDYEKGFVLDVSIALLTLISIGFLGGLIFYNEIKNNQLKRV